MDPQEGPRQSSTVRFKCAACYKQYKKKEHLVEHMKVSNHSVHQPKCGVCQKHCRSFESLREHLIGPLAKAVCAQIFFTRGCDFCLKVFENSEALIGHQRSCRLSQKAPLGPGRMQFVESKLEDLNLNEDSQVPEAVALDCEMVGGGSDGSFDICARVCLIDECENVIFHAYVKPTLSVTDYRYAVTGLTEEHFKAATPLEEVREKIQEILRNGESIWRMRTDGGRARLLVGHSLDHDLDCLNMYYADHMLRDTAKYHPLMKTNLVSHSLKYLTKTYLGYDIQSGTHDPYEDCVAAMRIYKRMRAQEHGIEVMPTLPIHPKRAAFDSLKPEELEKMSPDELFSISTSNYRCWCLDSRPVSHSWPR